MWSGYYYKLIDGWTTPLFRAPRWLSANSYPTLFDPLDQPDLHSPASGSITLGSSAVLPLEWLLSDTATPSISNNLQNFFEAFSAEKEYLLKPLLTTTLSRSFFFDTSDPQYLWVAEVNEAVQEVIVNTASGGSAYVSRANSLNELFYSANWKYYQEENLVYFSGMDIQAVSGFVASGWQFLNATSRWSSGSLVYFQHPNSGNWIPLHPSRIRQDGFTYLYAASGLKFRAHSPVAGQHQYSFTAYINGTEYHPRRVDVTNSLDEKAILVNLSRKYSETNFDLAETILHASWFRGQSYRETRSYLSAALRTSILQTHSCTSSGFTIVASGTGYQIRNVSKHNYTREKLIAPASGYSYISAVASGDLLCTYVNDAQTISSAVSSVVSFSSHVNTNTDLIYADWKVDYWLEDGNDINFTTNMPGNIPDLTVLFSRKVEVNYPSNNTLKKSYSKTSPSLKWSRDPLTEEAQGLAVFDF